MFTAVPVVVSENALNEKKLPKRGGAAVVPVKLRKTAKKKFPRKKSDELLKGAFEDNFLDFLRFVYSDAEEIVDFDRGIDFMDKELFAIIPVRDRTGDKRVADLLARLYLKDGTEKWVLLNVEIEGGSDDDFAYRFYQYNYRIRDRYQVSVASIAVFTGDKQQLRPIEYKDELLGTLISFKYLTYHIFDHSPEVLLSWNNPFALIALACQKALLEDKIPEEELGEERLTIARTLIAQGYDKERIISLLVFLKGFIFIDNKEINYIFDQQIQELTGGTINMGIIETIKMQERREGKLEGKREGRHEERAKALEEKKAIALNLKNKNIALSIISNATGLSIAEIEAL